MFTFQITFKSEACSPEPQFRGNEIPPATASICKSFTARVCYVRQLDLLQEGDEGTLAFPNIADVRKGPGWLQSKEDVLWSQESHQHERTPRTRACRNGITPTSRVRGLENVALLKAFCPFLLLFIFIYLKGRYGGGERQREKEVIHPLIRSPKACHSQSWPGKSQESGTPTVSPMGNRDSIT